MSARIIFHRGGGWTDMYRAYKLSVSGREVAKIKRNSSVTVEVEATQHMLTASIDWCSSNILFVDLAQGGTLAVDVVNPHGPWKGQKVIYRAPDTYLQLGLRDE
ncbi:MAG: hypothetical protein AAFW87_13590 [Pseudomonadota bacterium]